MQGSLALPVRMTIIYQTRKQNELPKTSAKEADEGVQGHGQSRCAVWPFVSCLMYRSTITGLFKFHCT